MPWYADYCIGSDTYEAKFIPSGQRVPSHLIKLEWPVLKDDEIKQVLKEFALTRDKAATPSLPIPDGTQEQPR